MMDVKFPGNFINLVSLGRALIIIIEKALGKEGVYDGMETELADVCKKANRVVVKVCLISVVDKISHTVLKGGICNRVVFTVCLHLQVMA